MRSLQTVHDTNIFSVQNNGFEGNLTNTYNNLPTEERLGRTLHAYGVLCNLMTELINTGASMFRTLSKL